MKKRNKRGGDTRGSTGKDWLGGKGETQEERNTTLGRRELEKHNGRVETKESTG